MLSSISSWWYVVLEHVFSTSLLLLSYDFGLLSKKNKLNLASWIAFYFFREELRFIWTSLLFCLYFFHKWNKEILSIKFQSYVIKTTHPTNFGVKKTQPTKSFWVFSGIATTKKYKFANQRVFFFDQLSKVVFWRNIWVSLVPLVHLR